MLEFSRKQVIISNQYKGYMYLYIHVVVDAHTPGDSARDCPTANLRWPGRACGRPVTVNQEEKCAVEDGGATRVQLKYESFEGRTRNYQAVHYSLFVMFTVIK